MGAKVVINYFDAQEEGEKTLAEIAAAGGEAILVQGDMTSSSRCGQSGYRKPLPPLAARSTFW